MFPKTQIEISLQELAGQGRTPAKPMYDPALRRAVVLAQGQEAVEGAHAVEDQRLAVGFAQTDVEGEKLLLHEPISA